MTALRARRLAAIALCAALSLQPAIAADEVRGDTRVDVLAYRFRIELSDDSDAIQGEATIRLRVVREGAEGVTLDLVGPPAAATGMRVQEVLDGDSPVPFRHAADRLEVTFAERGRAGGQRTLRVRYGGVPADGLVIGRNRHGERTFFGDNWPNRARHWLPVIDHVADKAFVRFDVIAPAHYQVVANGSLLESTDLGDGRRRTIWRSRAPLPTKVMVIGVARFAVQFLEPVGGVPVQSWVYPQDRDAGFHDFAVARRILEFFSERIGPFAYAKLANVQSTTRYGGMENAGAIFYSERAIRGDGANEALLAHEIAHQWFGDAVTEGDWHHVWLSEGFATYFTELYLEHTYGRDRLHQGMRQARERVRDFLARAGEAPVIDESITDLNALLSPNAYQRGAWVLHMLRQRIGDEAFWAGIRAYYERFRDANALSEDLRAAMEEASGENLEAFFEQWLRRPDLPALGGSWRVDDGGTLTVLLRQRQPGAPFELDVPLRIAFASGTTRDETVRLTDREATFTFAGAGPVRSVTLDPDAWLLYRDAGFGPRPLEGAAAPATVARTKAARQRIQIDVVGRRHAEVVAPLHLVCPRAQ